MFLRNKKIKLNLYILLKYTTKDRKIVVEIQLAAEWLGSEEEVLVGIT